MTGTVRTARLSPVTRHVRGLDGEYYLLAEVAAALDVPVPTLRRLKREDPELWGPSETTQYGDRTICLYTPADLTRLAHRFAKLREEYPAMVSGSPGRPRMWSLAEAEDRQRRFAAAHYAGRRAEQLRATDPPGARVAYNRCRLLLRDLRAEAEVRRSYLATRM